MDFEPDNNSRGQKTWTTSQGQCHHEDPMQGI